MKMPWKDSLSCTALSGQRCLSSVLPFIRYNNHCCAHIAPQTLFCLCNHTPTFLYFVDKRKNYLEVFVSSSHTGFPKKDVSFFSKLVLIYLEMLGKVKRFTMSRLSNRTSYVGKKTTRSIISTFQQYFFLSRKICF